MSLFVTDGIGQCTGCYNTDFDKGDFQCWKGQTAEQQCFNNPGPNCQFSNPQPGLDSSHIIVPSGAGFDPEVGGNTLPMANPYGGNYSVQLGNSTANYGAESLSRSFMITQTNSILSLAYAVVFEDPAGHTPEEKPYFQMLLTDSVGDTIDCGSYVVVAGGAIPGFVEYTPGKWYKPWAQVLVPLYQYRGQIVNMEVRTGDCAKGGHFGYAYLDAGCSDPTLTARLDCDGTWIKAPSGLLDYAWYNEITGQLLQQGPTDSMLVNDPGTYSCIVTGENNCPVNMAITVDAANPLQVISVTDQPNSCYGVPDATIDVVAQDGYQPLSYSIDGGITFVPYGNFGTIPEGGYEVIVMDSLGCADTTLVDIVGPTEIVSNLSVTPATCHGDCDGKAIATPSGGTPPYAYTWTNTNALGNDADNLCPNNYQLLIEDANGCPKHQVFSISEPAEVDLIVSEDTIICYSTAASLWANGQFGVIPYTYYWDNVASGNTNTVTPTANQVYDVYAIDSNGCRSPSKKIVVQVLEPLDVTAFYDQSICYGEKANIFAHAQGGDGNYQYKWSDSIGVGQYVSVWPEVTEGYEVTVTDGCGTPPAMDDLLITVKDIPVFDLSILPDKGCKPLTVSFNSLLSWGGIDHINIDYGNGNKEVSNGPIDHQYVKEGIYDVSLEIIAHNGCSLVVDSNEAITVYPKPEAQFEYRPKDPDLYSPNVSFTDQSVGALYWFWDFGDGETSAESSPQHMYEDTNTYIIEQIVENEYGCTDSMYAEIPVAPIFNIFIPNAFTPDGNGDNDDFIFKAYGIKEETIQFYIFDRWGDVLYEAFERKPWDGRTRQGEMAKQDVYVWLLNFTDVFNKKHQMQGHVTLIR
jgi:gliding motility-associated-like protein